MNLASTKTESLFSAYAEVVPSRSPTHSVVLAFLRVCGGSSEIPLDAALKNLFSPRMRR
ncbi:Hypothetical protein Cul131001_1879 [Corynebacterium ulcerans]|nr:Hypothetical protein Cul131001_1879 [Corynebacterium ulcerans]